jgi:DNA replication and repair protein RecF
MYFSSLELKNYRNFADLKLNLDEGVQIFVGQNGQGKTNILESIYLCCRGVSFRATTTQSLVNQNYPGQLAYVKSAIQKSGLEFQIRYQFNEGKRSLILNEKRATSQDLVERFPVILFSPESLAAIKDGPEQRRHLVDEALVSHDPRNMDLLIRFRKALATRNKILRDHKSERSTLLETREMLESLDQLYIPLAAQLTHQRIQAINSLQNDFKTALKFFFREQNVDSSVDYLVSDAGALKWELSEVNDALQKRVQEIQNAELSAGNSLVGPHKHDIKISFDNRDSRYYCSQGQQRALILSFKMAQIMYYSRIYNENPVLLLDDVMSELDQYRREHLLEFLKEIRTQIFLTTTDFSFSQNFNRGQVSVFEVQNGQVSLAV